MFLNFDDNRPETPTIPRAISIREAVMASLLLHAALLLLYVFFPGLFARPSPDEQAMTPDQQEPIRFVEVRPLKELPAPPRRIVDQSDLDRRSLTRERAPDPRNMEAFSRGNTPEKVVGGPEAAPASSDPVPPPPAKEPTPAALDALLARLETPDEKFQQAVRNPRQFLQQNNFDNQLGGSTEQSADIQFDSKGIDFGPWLRRFKNQVERNWIVPQAAASLRGRVVIQFYVLRSGMITELRVFQPSTIEAFTWAALNALKLSNPTAPLPAEYPADQVFFTVTFHYNDFDRALPQ